MTKFFIEKGFKIYVINSLNRKFDLTSMSKSMTFCDIYNSKILISDRHTRNFQSLSQEIQKKMIKRVWG